MGEFFIGLFVLALLTWCWWHYMDHISLAFKWHWKRHAAVILHYQYDYRWKAAHARAIYLRGLKDKFKSVEDREFDAHLRGDTPRETVEEWILFADVYDGDNRDREYAHMVRGDLK